MNRRRSYRLLPIDDLDRPVRRLATEIAERADCAVSFEPKRAVLHFYRHDRPSFGVGEIRADELTPGRADRLVRQINRCRMSRRRKDLLEKKARDAERYSRDQERARMFDERRNDAADDIEYTRERRGLPTRFRRHVPLSGATTQETTS